MFSHIPRFLLSIIIAFVQFSRCKPLLSQFSRINLLYSLYCSGGDEEDRTPDPLLARQVLSQLSYTPKFCHIQTFFVYVVGLSGLEPPTSRLSGVRSNLLSYRPALRVTSSCPSLFFLDLFYFFLFSIAYFFKSHSFLSQTHHF